MGVNLPQMARVPQRRRSSGAEPLAASLEWDPGGKLTWQQPAPGTGHNTALWSLGKSSGVQGKIQSGSSRPARVLLLALRFSGCWQINQIGLLLSRLNFICCFPPSPASPPCRACVFAELGLPRDGNISTQISKGCNTTETHPRASGCTDQKHSHFSQSQLKTVCTSRNC